MKIQSSDGSSGIQRLVQKVQQTEGADQTRAAESPKPAPGEKVEISQEAREVQRLKEILEQIPNFREKKIEELRQLIESDQYEADLGKVSDKILQALIIGDL
jgi:flagellar biosynthesis anti-sigma factor FlgM